MTSNAIAPAAIGAGAGTIYGAKVASYALQKPHPPMRQFGLVTALFAAPAVVGAAVTSAIGQGEPNVAAAAAGMGAAIVTGGAMGLLFGGIGAIPGAAHGAIGGFIGVMGATIGAGVIN